MPKAIVILGDDNLAAAGEPVAAAEDRDRIGNSFATLELLGQSVLDRVLGQLSAEGVDPIVIMAQDEEAKSTAGFKSDVLPGDQQNLWRRAEDKLAQLGLGGEQSALIMRLGSYVELRPTELLQFLSDTGESVVRAFKDLSALEVWAVDPSRLAGTVQTEGTCLQSLLTTKHSPCYAVEGYVNRLCRPRDVRTLIGDALNGRCSLRPLGFEVRPGVWMAEGAEVENEARIVAPAYVGKDVTVSRQCLITRGSNIERDSLVDYGTVIEDTTILPNTYVGIGLDVSHSIVDGDTLLNLQHEVMLRVEDAAVMRRNKILGGPERTGWWTSLRIRDRVQAAIDESAA